MPTASALGFAEAHSALAGGADAGEGVHAVAAHGAARGREHDVQPAPFGLVLGQRDVHDGLLHAEVTGDEPTEKYTFTVGAVRRVRELIALQNRLTGEKVGHDRGAHA